MGNLLTLQEPAYTVAWGPFWVNCSTQPSVSLRQAILEDEMSIPPIFDTPYAESFTCPAALFLAPILPPVDNLIYASFPNVVGASVRLIFGICHRERHHEEPLAFETPIF